MYQLISQLVRRLTKPILFGIMIMSVPLAGMAADLNPSLNGSVKHLNKSVIAPTAVKKNLANPGAVSDKAPCICGTDDNGVETCTPKGCGLKPFPSESKLNAATMKQPTRTTTMPRR